MPISELRQTVRNLYADACQLQLLISHYHSYGADIISIYNQLCDVVDNLNNELEELEGEGEDIHLVRSNPAA